MTRPDRKYEITRLMREGADAFHAGKSYGACPYADMNAVHWKQGYRDAEAAQARSEVDELKAKVEDSVDLYDLKRATLELVTMLQNKGVI